MAALATSAATEHRCAREWGEVVPASTMRVRRLLKRATILIWFQYQNNFDIRTK
jgi:hypothetical protein